MSRDFHIKIIPVDFISPDSFISRLVEFEATNCIVIWRKDVAVVIDPGGEGERIARFLRRRNLTVGAYWLTHAHPDHIGGLSVLLDEFSAPVRYHRADSRWVKAFKVRHPINSKWLSPFGDVKKIVCGDIVAKVILTPGHSCGGVCYWFESFGALMTGDTLMRGADSETKDGGDEVRLAYSLRKILRSVPDNTKVFSGHGGITTIGAERGRLEISGLKIKKTKTVIEKAFASFDNMQRAFNKVRKELEGMGLLFQGSCLDKVDCYHERFSVGGLAGFKGWMGFYDPEDGDIHVPAVYPAGLFPWWEERRILDVLRHEFGHVLADNYRKFFRGGIFKAAFGASYGNERVFDGDDWTDEYVSEYASTTTQEDFAETFMLYMKHKGRSPVRYNGKSAVEMKWNAVRKIVKGIAAMNK